MEINKEVYIGDGVYASYDGYHLVLRIDDGSKIYLDSQVMSALKDIIEELCTS